jgi:hypothetical protein
MQIKIEISLTFAEISIKELNCTARAKGFVFCGHSFWPHSIGYVILILIGRF